jgi:hypothetical protein
VKSIYMYIYIHIYICIFICVYIYIYTYMYKKKAEYAKIWKIFTLIEFRSSSHSPGVLSASWVIVCQKYSILITSAYY